MVAHACDPSTLGGQDSGSPEVTSLGPAWPTRWNPVSTKNTKISWAWWCAPVVPATWEAETGESLEPGRQRLQWTEIMPLHSSLGNRARHCLKKKKKLGMVAHVWSPSYLRGWGRRIVWTQEAEVAVSQDCATALHLGNRARLRFKNIIIIKF